MMQLGSIMSTSKSTILAIPNKTLSLLGHSKSTSPMVLANWAQFKSISTDDTFLDTVMFMKYQQMNISMIMMIVHPVPIHERQRSNKLKYPIAQSVHNLYYLNYYLIFLN